jgi:hypothetical protein
MATMLSSRPGTAHAEVYAARWHTGGMMTKVVRRHDGMYVVQYYPSDPLRRPEVHAYTSEAAAERAADDTLATIGHSCGPFCSCWCQISVDSLT